MFPTNFRGLISRIAAIVSQGASKTLNSLQRQGLCVTVQEGAPQILRCMFCSSSGFLTLLSVSGVQKSAHSSHNPNFEKLEDPTFPAYLPDHKADGECELFRHQHTGAGAFAIVPVSNFGSAQFTCQKSPLPAKTSPNVLVSICVIQANFRKASSK
jgi:hypothetical protein